MTPEIRDTIVGVTAFVLWTAFVIVVLAIF
jgi:hypothetical protein